MTAITGLPVGPHGSMRSYGGGLSQMAAQGRRARRAGKPRIPSNEVSKRKDHRAAWLDGWDQEDRMIQARRVLEGRW